jgi:signal transduction histidine kinase
LQLYRIAQESVCNAIKHSGASRILIAIEVSDGETKLKIADNGNGFHDEHTHVGLGIQSMQYRAELIGANLQISTSTSGGTVVCCAIDESKDE